MSVRIKSGEERKRKGVGESKAETIGQIVVD